MLNHLLFHDESKQEFHSIVKLLKTKTSSVLTELNLLRGYKQSKQLILIYKLVMTLHLIPMQESKSGDSISFTNNGFQQYWIKKNAFDIPIVISNTEDWNNKYLIEFDEEDLVKYGQNYSRINIVVRAFKL